MYIRYKVAFYTCGHDIYIYLFIYVYIYSNYSTVETITKSGCDKTISNNLTDTVCYPSALY